MTGESELLRESPVAVVFAPGALARLGTLAQREGARRALLVTDPGIVAAGHVERAVNALTASGVAVTVFDGVRENPTTEHVAAGLAAARAADIDALVAVGGGSAMDCAKGVSLLLAGGGAISDYRGDPPADVLAERPPLLPLIVVPTTAGTGSEAQSFALIADAATHQKMPCGDRRLPRDGGLRPRVAILDPELTRTQPRDVAVLAGIDAISHAVETAGTRRRSAYSRRVSKAAWWLLSQAFERAIANPDDDAARADMLMGAHLAGLAIEHSMLGAAHSCANPLTARYGIAHGHAVGVMLPHVIRFNSAAGERPYEDLAPDGETLARRIETLLTAGGLQRDLASLGVTADALDDMAELAAAQWTAQFNPRSADRTAMRTLYAAARPAPAAT